MPTRIAQAFGFEQDSCYHKGRVRLGWERTAKQSPASPNQKFAGVLALMISASSGPMFLKLCGRVVGM